MPEIKSLLEFDPGTTVRVVRINAGRGLKLRLLSLGLVPGADIYVLDNRHGPVKLCFNNSRIAVGRGVAAKVLAAAASDDVCPECETDEPCPKK
ncbi:MAG TPA: FeoA domain-containing protein [bacterium]|nr:FeoA domain-containing protein [bacterium]